MEKTTSERSTRLKIVRLADLFARGVFPEKEFAHVALDHLIADETCDAAAIVAELDYPARQAIARIVREYAAKDYLVVEFLLGLTQEETERDAVERQPSMRKTCEVIMPVLEN